MGYETLMWIPRHSGFPGNEMVDFLTRLPTFSNGRYPDDDIHLKNVQTNMINSDISLTSLTTAHTSGTANFLKVLMPSHTKTFFPR